MYRYHTTIIYLILIITFFITGCGSSASSTPEETSTNTTDTAIMPSNKAMSSGQVVDSLGTGIEGVKVNIGNSYTVTDNNGYYTLTNLSENTKETINFQKEGYFLGSTQIQINHTNQNNDIAKNYLEYSMDTYTNEWNYNSSDSAVGGHINIPASTCKTSDDLLYSGSIYAKLKILDITSDKGKSLFPGSFEGLTTSGNTVKFASYGLISIILEDDNKNPLDFIEGSSVYLTFDATPNLSTEIILPLWYYDYNQGIWVEDGYAELQSDDTYKGKITHPGTWNIAKVVEDDPGIYHGRILNVEGEPISNVRLNATGLNWVSKDLSTDENGIFMLEVVPNSDFQISAYDYEEKYSAKFDGIITGIQSGVILEN